VHIKLDVIGDTLEEQIPASYLIVQEDSPHLASESLKFSKSQTVNENV
jgi:hypothetical protein